MNVSKHKYSIRLAFVYNMCSTNNVLWHLYYHTIKLHIIIPLSLVLNVDLKRCVMFYGKWYSVEWCWEFPTEQASSVVHLCKHLETDHASFKIEIHVLYHITQSLKACKVGNYNDDWTYNTSFCIHSTPTFSTKYYISYSDAPFLNNFTIFL